MADYIDPFKQRGEGPYLGPIKPDYSLVVGAFSRGEMHTLVSLGCRLDPQERWKADDFFDVLSDAVERGVLSVSGLSKKMLEFKATQH